MPTLCYGDVEIGDINVNDILSLLSNVGAFAGLKTWTSMATSVSMTCSLSSTFGNNCF